LGFKYEFTFHVLNLAKAKKIKKYFGLQVLLFLGQQLQRKTRHNILSWSLLQCMVLVNNLVRDGANTIIVFWVDVRSIRYPGLISWSSPPGGGTTDYAVDIFHKALSEKKYECFLSSETKMPMMYMDDAIKATIDIMQADADKIKIRSSYNLAAMSFTPAEIVAEIQKHIPDFTITYVPDSRQQIADSWPSSIDDSLARQDWGWYHEFDLKI